MIDIAFLFNGDTEEEEWKGDLEAVDILYCVDGAILLTE